MDRAERLALLKANPFYAKGFTKLTVPEKELVDNFLFNHSADNQAVWSTSVRKLFVDNPNKPKNWTLIYEILQTLA